MTSKAKIKSNRSNARKSTGPKSDVGKATAALNAVKHGLSSASDFTQEDRQEIAGWVARFLAGTKPDQETEYLANDAAEAHVSLKRIQKLRSEVWHAAGLEPEIARRGAFAGLVENELVHGKDAELRSIIRRFSKFFPHVVAAPFKSDVERDMAVVEIACDKLVKLQRYERRAFNRRNKALRALVAHQKTEPF